MTATPILSDAARAGKLVAVEAELAEPKAEGVRIAVTASDLVAAEEKGLILDLETGAVVEPFVALDRRGGRQ